MQYLKATYNKDNKIVLSQVENPAMKGVNVLLAENKKPLQVALSEENDKQIIYCVALSPHVPVYRNAESMNGEEATILWDSQVIELTANDFITQGQVDGGSLNHSEQTQDIKVIQSWTVQDAECDKAVALGMEVKGGEWIIGQEVLSVELWEQFKSGDYTGISIEGMFGMVQLSEQKPITFESLINNFLINN
jgi:hypothetical protein